MKHSDRDRFDGRLKTASEANQSRLERFQAAANDPERLAKRAMREEANAARIEERQAKAAKLLQQKEDRERQHSQAAKRAEEQAMLHAAELEAETLMTADQMMVQTTARDAERKAERDRRYAARRNRKR